MKTIENLVEETSTKNIIIYNNMVSEKTITTIDKVIENMQQVINDMRLGNHINENID